VNTLSSKGFPFRWIFVFIFTFFYLVVIFSLEIDSTLKSIKENRVLSALDAKIKAAEKLPESQSIIKYGLIQQRKYIIESAFASDNFSDSDKNLSRLHPRLLPDYHSTVYELRKTFLLSPSVDRIIQWLNPVAQLLLSQNADRLFLHALLHVTFATITLAMTMVIIASNRRRKEK